MIEERADMAYFRFYRRIPLIPGLLSLNLSKGGVSLSLRKWIFTMTYGKHGMRFTAGLPGTGVSVSKHITKTLNQGKDAVDTSDCIE